MLLALLAFQVLTTMTSADPFAFFQPSATITADERAQLDRGQPIARVLPGKDLEVAVLAAVPVNIDADRLVAWMRRIEELKGLRIWLVWPSTTKSCRGFVCWLLWASLCLRLRSQVSPINQ